MPPPLNWPLLREKLARHTEALLADGYVVLDDFLGRACAHQLRDEMSRAPMSPNSTQFGTVRYSKPGVVECDLHGVPEAHLRREMPLFHELFEHCAQYDEPDLQCALEDASAASPTPLSLARGPRSTTIKLQRNVGGAFPLHYDNPAPPNKRCVTLLVYLNEMDEAHQRGGVVRLQPFLAPPVEVTPTMDRALLFLSHRVLHGVTRVVPPFQRHCFTVWIDASDLSLVNGPDCVALRRDMLCGTIGEVGERLRNSPAQRAIARAVYAQEFEASLIECMEAVVPDDQARDDDNNNDNDNNDDKRPHQLQSMLALHRQEIMSIRSNPTLNQLVDIFIQHKD